MFPPDGPTRTKILGESTPEKQDIAERKRDYMNWQLTEQIEEFKDETEQLLTQLPLGGSQFMKMWYDEKKKRPCAEFVPIDNILLPFASANFYNGLSVLPYDGGSYIQAPFEDITEERYYEMFEKLHSIDLSKVVETQDNTDLSGELACAGGACEIK